ncbi:hypothetical protein DAPPUDRAFT_333083 [Daphnia pulex]|uniref:Uncharacterized protein n=1 Tax=Daphnia pulex TaxID=6669 RepID=E9HRS9_DAPPU|nr:hypothetical protein DAPPUDRAFT_333083 [Daphnia pulex]|eukprot:EFX65564.1 hypothetical protein DAPPUDRAFT_333083 [Daphnia pulex]
MGVIITIKPPVRRQLTLHYDAKWLDVAVRLVEITDHFVFRESAVGPALVADFVAVVLEEFNCIQFLHYKFLTHWHDRFDEKSYFEGKGQGPHSQQGSLFANPLAATLQSPCLLPYTGPIDLRVTLLRLMTSSHQLL